MRAPDRPPGAREALVKRLPSVAAIALVVSALLSPAADAASTGLRLRAVSGGRVSVRLTGPVPAGRVDIVLDGRRLRRTRRHAVVLTLPRNVSTHDGKVRWRWIEVHAAGSRRLLAQRRFALAARTSRRAPTLVVLDAPAASSAATTARLRFSASDGRTSCSLDGGSSRPCSSPTSYRGLSPGAHNVTIRAQAHHGRSSISVEWTTTGTSPIVSPPAYPLPSTPLPAVGRKLVFEDDFDGTTLDTASWNPYNSTGNAGNGLRRPSALSLDGDGHLVITADMADGQIVSGGMSNKLNLTYGVFEFRVRTDPDPAGTMSGVVLTWPQSGRWPEDGENDVYETNAAVNTRWPFYSFVHYTSSNKQYYFRHDADGAQWHTMLMDWSADAIKIYRDGVLVWTLGDSAAIPDVAHHLCIQLDARATRTLTTPVRMYVDYVRVYQ
jgi:hypothetical protein